MKMVITGPLLVQPVVKPPHLEVKNAYEKLKVVGSSYHFNQQLYDGFPSNENNSHSRQKSYDIPVEKSWKHADLFVPTQQNYVFESSVTAYPFGNTIPSSQYIPEDKYVTDAPTPFIEKAYPTVDYDNLTTGKLDFDFLNILLPTKDEQLSASNIIPDQPLELLYNNTPHDQPLEPTRETGIWDNVLHKDSALESYPDQEILNPFVNDFETHEPRLYTAESCDSLIPDVTNQSSPSTAASSPVVSKPSPWSEELQELFEKTFDFSDIDMDLILPPAPKRIHDSINSDEENVTQSLFASPDQLPETSEPLPSEPSVIKSEEEEVKPKPVVFEIDKRKVKSTVLFGKHEDEIIHKLLVPELSTSRKPVTRDKLVSMPVEEFNHLLELAQLNDIEVAFMKEWRRRGKNKTAAQIARKRKREEVGDLESEVEQMRQQKVELRVRYDQLRSKIASLKERSLAAEKSVYERFNQSSGQPLTRDTHLIHVTNGNKLLLVPRINSQIIAVN